MKILVVEDQIEVLDCLRSYFEEQGNEVQVASNAPDALVLLEKRAGLVEDSFPTREEGIPFDLAFIDLLLPKGHGREVVREIAKRNEAASLAPGQAKRRATRMVVITASEDLELRREMLDYGVSDYLFKPVTIRDLECFLIPPAVSQEVHPGE